MPKISSSSRHSRRRRVPLSTQTAEQLAEVPEFVSFAFLFQQQIVDAPESPRGFLPAQDYLLVWERDRGHMVTVVGLVGEVFQFSPRSRIQQRLVEWNKLTFQFPVVEVFKADARCCG